MTRNPDGGLLAARADARAALENAIDVVEENWARLSPGDRRALSVAPGLRLRSASGRTEGTLLLSGLPEVPGPRKP